jgi:hypothetical protein
MAFFDRDLYVSEVLDGQVPGFSSRADEFNWAPAPAKSECVSQLPQQHGLKSLIRGSIAFGTITGETELYLGTKEENGLKEGEVAIFGVGSCKNLECATLQNEIKGTPGGSFGSEVEDVAVDESSSPMDWAKGDIFIVPEKNFAGNVIDIFKPLPGGGAEYKTAIQNLTKQAERIAISEFSGDIVVLEKEVIEVYKPEQGETYTSAGIVLRPPGGSFKGTINNVAVDGGNGEIYVATSAAIYEFESDGGYAGQLTGVSANKEEAGHSFSESYEPVSVAVDPATHDLFVGVFEKSLSKGVVDVFGPDIVVPDVSTGSVSDLGLESTSGLWKLDLEGEVRPNNEGVATCRFMWGTSKSLLNNTAPCSSNVPNGSTFIPVQASLEGLRPDTTYYYRLGASNINGENPGEEFEDREFTTPGPGLVGESVSEVSSSSARLEASITPHDSPVEKREQELQASASSGTTYYFQYSTGGTEGCGVGPVPCVSVPLTPVNVGSGASVVKVSQRVLGLRPDTPYHYRVVAANEGLPVSDPGIMMPFFGSDGVFVTQGVSSGSLVLPDGRVWELVSPVDKRGGVISPIGESGVAQAAENGGAFTYLSSLPSESEPGGYGDLAQIYSERTSDGWSSGDIELSHEAPVGPLVGQGHEYRFFSKDLSLGVAESFGPFSPPVSSGRLSEAFPEATERTPYLRHDSTCASDPMDCFMPIVSGCPALPRECPERVEENADVPRGTVFDSDPASVVGTTNFVGATSDLSHVVLSSRAALTSSPAAPHGGLYEWSDKSPTESIEPVSVLPPGEGGEVAEAGLGDFKITTPVARHMVSEDGSRVFFTAEGPQGRHLYMRDQARSETVRLDLPGSGLQAASGSAVFQSASGDGSVSFFTDGSRLTEGSGAEPTMDDLYRCEMGVVEEAGVGKEKCGLSDLTPVGAHGESAGVQGGVLTSDDGGYVYFVADGVLAEGAIPGECSVFSVPPEGATCNLYVWHEGVTKFIAKLSADDAPDWGAKSGLIGMTSRVSPDGLWFAFMSDRSLTGYDNRDVVSGVPDEEVYLYSAVSGRLVCASCDPSGARPVGVEYRVHEDGLSTGDRVWPPERWLAANIPGWTPYTTGDALYQSRFLSDGGRLFFDSNDALVSQDTNGSEDVYEFEPGGVGDCAGSSSTFVGLSDGCVGLISSGLAVGESAFLDASVSGGDVLFLTTGKLVPEDVDTALDVYDAHECTVTSSCFVSSGEEVPVCESAASCRVSPSPQPLIYGSPSSATFAGTGNIVEPAVVVPGGKSVKKVVLTRSEKLASALRACKRSKSHEKRVACEKRARKSYGAPRKPVKGK